MRRNISPRIRTTVSIYGPLPIIPDQASVCIPHAMESSLVLICAVSATNCLTLSWISSRTRRNTSLFWSINPPAVFGSAIFQCKTASAKGNIGLLSLAVSQMVITWPNGSFNDCATLLVFWPEISIPASFITSLARGLDALRSTPTLTTSNRSPVRLRRKPSAIKLRVALPVERNRTFGLCLVISPHFVGSSWPMLSTRFV